MLQKFWFLQSSPKAPILRYRNKDNNQLSMSHLSRACPWKGCNIILSGWLWLWADRYKLAFKYSCLYLETCHNCQQYLPSYLERVAIVQVNSCHRCWDKLQWCGPLWAESTLYFVFTVVYCVHMIRLSLTYKCVTAAFEFSAEYAVHQDVLRDTK